MWIHALEDEANLAPPSAERQARFEQSPRLQLRMFRVHAGEAILIEPPGAPVWLVDGGNTNGVSRNKDLACAIKRYLTAKSLTLEAVVASHRLYPT